MITPSIAPKFTLGTFDIYSTTVAQRFLLIFSACLLSLLGKGVALGSPFGHYLNFIVPEQKLPVTGIIIATMFLPGFLLGVASCWHRGILKTILAHPSIILMPTFTHFTFASSTKWCKRSSKEEVGEQEEGGETEKPFITFSAKFTFLNVGASVICHGVYGLGMTLWFALLPEYLGAYLIAGVPLFILGLLFTLLTLALTSTRQTCFNRPRPNCCCTSSTLPRVEFGALLPTPPHSHYVLDDNGKPQPVLEDEEVKSEDTEMVNNEKTKMIDNQDDETL